MYLRRRLISFIKQGKIFWLKAWIGSEQRLDFAQLRGKTPHRLPLSWVLLHLIAVSVSVSLLETLAGSVHVLSPSTKHILDWYPFPELSNTLTSVALILLLFTTFCACLLYLLLMSLRPHWRQRWSTLACALILLASIAYLIGLHNALAIQFRLGILAYGLIACLDSAIQRSTSLSHLGLFLHLQVSKLPWISRLPIRLLLEQQLTSLRSIRVRHPQRQTIFRPSSRRRSMPSIIIWAMSFRKVLPLQSRV